MRSAAVALVSAVVALEGRVEGTRSADPADVGLALRKGVKSAIGAAAGVAGAPGAVGVRWDAGQGHRGQCGGGEKDRSHKSLLGE